MHFFIYTITHNTKDGERAIGNKVRPCSRTITEM